MLTQYKKQSGEGFFDFVTTIGDGIESVDVTLAFDYDESGPYNEYIAHVMYKGIDIAGCLTEETINALEIEAIGKRDTK